MSLGGRKREVKSSIMPMIAVRHWYKYKINADCQSLKYSILYIYVVVLFDHIHIGFCSSLLAQDVSVPAPERGCFRACPAYRSGLDFHYIHPCRY